MNDDDRLTPEERKLIEAAIRWYDTGPAPSDEVIALRRAVEGYLIPDEPPEPYEGFAARSPDGRLYRMVHEDSDNFFTDFEIWRCQVTPIERVR